MRSTATSAGSEEPVDQPAVYVGRAQPGIWGGTDSARLWRCRRCRRTVDDHYLSGHGCVPREDLVELVYELEDPARQEDQDHAAQPPPVRQALAVLQEHGWQVQQEHHHPDLDHPHRQTRLVTSQPWQDWPLR